MKFPFILLSFIKLSEMTLASPWQLIGLTAVLLLVTGGAARAHPPEGTVTRAATQFVKQLSLEQRGITVHVYEDSERFVFRWTPGQRSGTPLGKLNAQQNAALKAVLHHVLSHAGQNRVDAILATEAALGVIERRPAFRDPNLYYTSVFGAPEPARRWGLRFEGHHLSINLTFDGEASAPIPPLSSSEFSSSSAGASPVGGGLIASCCRGLARPGSAAKAGAEQ